MRSLRVLLAAVLCLAAGWAWAVDDPASVRFVAQEQFSEPEPLEKLPTVTTADGEPLADFSGDCGCGSCAECMACDDCLERSFYARVELFGFTELDESGGVLNRDLGAMPTIGIVRRAGRHRGRLELFGSQLQLDASLPGPPDELERVGNSSYLGGRAEYDVFLFPNWPKRSEFLAGIGFRSWNRHRSIFNVGLDELWVSLYPYIGLESRRIPGKWFFYRTRIGLTAFTYNHVEFDMTGPLDLYPAVGINSLVEIGARGERNFLSLYFEAFTWDQSAPDNGFTQATAGNVMLGLQGGFFF